MINEVMIIEKDILKLYLRSEHHYWEWKALPDVLDQEFVDSICDGWWLLAYKENDGKQHQV